jgi:hypothetical protein
MKIYALKNLPTSLSFGEAETLLREMGFVVRSSQRWIQVEVEGDGVYCLRRVGWRFTGYKKSSPDDRMSMWEGVYDQSFYADHISEALPALIYLICSKGDPKEFDRLLSDFSYLKIEEEPES